MICPMCNGKLRILEVRHAKMPDNDTFRYRRCVDCGYEFHTVEYEILWTEQAEKIWKNSYEKKEK